MKSTYSQDHLSMKHRLSWLVVERKYRFSSEQLALTPRYNAWLVLEVYLYINFPAVFFSSLNRKSWLVVVSHADCSYKTINLTLYVIFNEINFIWPADKNQVKLWSSQVSCNLRNCRKKSWKKIKRLVEAWIFCRSLFCICLMTHNFSVYFLCHCYQLSYYHRNCRCDYHFIKSCLLAKGRDWNLCH